MTASPGRDRGGPNAGSGPVVHIQHVICSLYINRSGKANIRGRTGNLRQPAEGSLSQIKVGTAQPGPNQVSLEDIGI